jgi:tetratricopeptide (TPR) repeat protein
MKCIQCGAETSGFTCPSCKRNQALLEEQERLKNEASEEFGRALSDDAERRASQLQEHEEALQEIERQRQEFQEEETERRREVVANAHRLQADKLTEKGYQLYKAGLLSDSLYHYQQAIDLDRTCVSPALGATACLARLGRTAEAAAMSERTISLLKLPEWRRQDRLHLLAFQSIPPENTSLTQALVEVLISNAGRKGWSSSCAGEIFSTLRDRGCGAAAVQFVESLVGRAPRVNAELVALFREMIRSGFTGEATRLIALCIFEQPNEIQPILKDLTDKRLFAEVGYLTKIGVSKHPRLAWHALTIKVAVLAAQDVHLVLLQHYLDQVAFRDRRKLLEEYEKLSTDQSKLELPGEVLAMIRGQLRSQYEKWQPSIIADFKSAADALRDSLSKESSTATIIGWIVGVVALLRAMSSAASVLLLQPGGAIWGSLVWASLGVSIFLGLMACRAVNKSKGEKAASLHLLQLEQAERQAWSKIFEAPTTATGGSFETR